MANLRNCIVTTFHGPTNFRGSRIRAVGGGESVVAPFDHALDSTDAHEGAARMVQQRLQWKGELVGTWVKCGGKGFYVWITI
jgi:hypothetical protein